MNANRILPLAFAVLGGCVSQPDQRGHDTAAPQDAETSLDGLDGDDSETAAAVGSTRPETELERALHDATMTEVVVDPSGEAALTLDADGGVRLWPSLKADEIAEPFVLPVHDPVWMSIAKAMDGFVVAFVDTVGGGRVARVRTTAQEGRWSDAFDVAATDPLFELHVLDGGQRVVGLGIDHQIDLWDLRGRPLSKVDEPGFVPWQLRVAQQPGSSPHIAAVLSNPVGARRIEIRDDTLVLDKELHRAAIDRGPNRNDLTMTPDGRFFLVLRKLERRGKVYTLDVIDTESGNRRRLSFETPSRRRPRVHPVDDGRVLLELRTGEAAWLDLSTAQRVSEDGQDETAPPSSAQQLDVFDLPVSNEELAVHAVVIDGRRIVPTGDGLVIDPLEADGYTVVGARPFSPSSAALDADGSTVAWAIGAGWILESVDGSTEPRMIGDTEAEPEHETELLAFLGHDRMVAMTDDGVVSLRDRQGTTLASQKMPFEWGISVAAWRSDVGGTGELVLSSIKPSEPLHVLGVQTQGVGEVRDVPRSEQSEWPRAGRPRRMPSRTWLEQLGYDFDDLQLRPTEVLEVNPDPTGRFVAIVQPDGRGHVVTLWDEREHRRRWTVAVPSNTHLGWSGDGNRLVVSHKKGGLVFDAATGDTLTERRNLGLSVTH